MTYQELLVENRDLQKKEKASTARIVSLEHQLAQWTCNKKVDN